MSDTGVNCAILEGYLSFDGDQRFTKTGKPVCSLKMETTDEYGSEGHRLTFWGELPPGMHKGARVRAEGRIATRRWKNKEGQDVATVEVVCSILRLVAGGAVAPEVRALAAGVAPGLAANLPAVEPGELPTLLPPYGRDRGKRIAGASLETLEWYAAGCRRNLADPAKARWRRSDEAMIRAIEIEQDAQRGMSGRNVGAAAMRGGGSSDPHHAPAPQMWGNAPAPDEDEDLPFNRPVQPSRMARLL